MVIYCVGCLSLFVTSFAYATSSARFTEQPFLLSDTAVAQTVVKPVEKTADETACRNTVKVKEVAPAVIQFLLSNPCRGNQIVTLRYRQYDYVMRLNEAGQGKKNIFLMTAKDQVKIIFEDGPGVKQTVETQMLPLIHRVIVRWYGDTQLDLHALEFGAQLNSDQDLCREKVCRLPIGNRSSYLYCYRGEGETPMNLQVYTYHIKQRVKHKGIIDFRLDYADRGTTPHPPYCGTGERASLNFHVEQLSKGRLKPTQKHYLRPVTCGQPLDNRTRYFKGPVDHIRVH